MADVKISQLTAKAAKVESTDRIPIADFNGTTYDTKYVTGSEINEVSLDTSPQLGGNLDVSTYKIKFNGTAGRIIFEDSSNFLAQSGNFFWDNTNSRLGIGTNTPSHKLHVNESVNGETRIQVSNTNTGTSASCITINSTTGNRYIASLQYGASVAGTYIGITAAGLSILESGADSSGLVINSSNSSSGTSFIAFATANSEKIRIDNGGNLHIGGTAAGTSAAKVLVQHTGTSPGSSPADAYQQYSADITAGNAAPHFRTENGNVVKLYQQSSAGITTVSDLVTILQNLGLLS
jgi:hypothetical protein